MYKCAINTVFLFALLGIAFSACNDSKVQDDKQQGGEIAEQLIEEEEMTEPEPRQEEVAPELANLPILLIQNCGALVPHSCISDSSEDLASEKAWLSKYFGEDTLVAIGQEGVFTLTLDSAFCMSGECGGRQIAFHVPHELCFGVVMGKQAYHQYGPFRFLSRWRDPAFKDSVLTSKLQLDSVQEMLLVELKRVKKVPRVSDCSYRYFVDSSHQYLLQGVSFGYEYEMNDTMEHPPIEQMSYQAQRRLVKIDSNWIVGPWLSLHTDWGDWLPETIAYALSGDTLINIQLSAQGICCPSLSNLRVTAQKIAPDTILTLWSESYDAGLGQPCD